MAVIRPFPLLAVLAILASVLAALWPHARDAGQMFAAQDDPAALSDVRLRMALQQDPAVLTRQIETALAAKDYDLAQSFLDVATAGKISVPADVAGRVKAASDEANSGTAIATRFAMGLMTGEAEDLAGLSGTVAGDLFVFGDVRDIVREGKRVATGEEADTLILGLAAAGIAVTAATYVSVGGAAPVRAGLTLMKDARKLGRLGAGLTEWAGRSARGVVDGPLLRDAAARASWRRSSETVDAVRASFRVDKAGALVRAAKDVGRVGEKAGVRGALDALKVSDGPKDIARAARLAESKGSQSRALLKMFGRGALLLAAGAFNLAWWIFGALLLLLGMVSSIKSGTERMTYAWLRHTKARRLAQQHAADAPPMIARLAPV